MISRGEPAYRSWSYKHAVERLHVDRETVFVTSLQAPVWFPALSIVYNGLCHEWFIQRDMSCVVAWRVK